MPTKAELYAQMAEKAGMGRIPYYGSPTLQVPVP